MTYGLGDKYRGDFVAFYRKGSTVMHKTIKAPSRELVKEAELRLGPEKTKAIRKGAADLLEQERATGCEFPDGAGCCVKCGRPIFSIPEKGYRCLGAESSQG